MTILIAASSGVSTFICMQDVFAVPNLQNLVGILAILFALMLAMACGLDRHPSERGKKYAPHLKLHEPGSLQADDAQW